MNIGISGAAEKPPRVPKISVRLLVGRPTIYRDGNGWEPVGAIVQMSPRRAAVAIEDKLVELVEPRGEEIETTEAAPAKQHAVIRKGRAKPRRKRKV